nr:MAG TPA: hypothetical protein [Caudoviricetes sp.]
MNFPRVFNLLTIKIKAGSQALPFFIIYTYSK